MNPKALYLAVALTIPVAGALAEPATPSNPPVIEATSLTDDELREDNSW
jgi:hypothetical protein